MGSERGPSLRVGGTSGLTCPCPALAGACPGRRCPAPRSMAGCRRVQEMPPQGSRLLQRCFMSASQPGLHGFDRCRLSYSRRCPSLREGSGEGGGQDGGREKSHLEVHSDCGAESSRTELPVAGTLTLGNSKNLEGRQPIKGSNERSRQSSETVLFFSIWL